MFTAALLTAQRQEASKYPADGYKLGQKAVRAITGEYDLTLERKNSDTRYSTG